MTWGEEIACIYSVKRFDLFADESLKLFLKNDLIGCKGSPDTSIADIKISRRSV